ncbi:MAG: hypothetical protein IJC02_04325 [Lachnospiraceae bacterium]|nr:hypothetical protein [Lachnospiraceae bacterium]MBQ6994810.1 hypothetical protein [Lachnospiraceae bacterium]
MCRAKVNGERMDFRLVVEPDTPFKVGETITIKGFTSGYTTSGYNDINKLGIQLICGARNAPYYECKIKEFSKV